MQTGCHQEVGNEVHDGNSSEQAISVGVGKDVPCNRTGEDAIFKQIREVLLPVHSAKTSSHLFWGATCTITVYMYDVEHIEDVKTGNYVPQNTTVGNSNRG